MTTQVYRLRDTYSYPGHFIPSVSLVTEDGCRLEIISNDNKQFHRIDSDGNK